MMIDIRHHENLGVRQQPYMYILESFCKWDKGWKLRHLGKLLLSTLYQDTRPEVEGGGI